MGHSEHSLILTIVNKGFSDAVMSAAREAGAKGGTTFNARGTGNVEIAKAFGMIIEPEKEVVLILTENAHRHEIMKAVYKATGLTSDASGFSISLPVTDVLGGFAMENYTQEKNAPAPDSQSDPKKENPDK